MYVFGEAHPVAEGTEPSIEQKSTMSVGSDSSTVKLNVAVVASVSPPDSAVGPLVMFTTGAVRSPISHENVAGVRSRAPPEPIAVTSKSWSPGSRPLYVTGEVHGCGVTSSSEHSKVAPAWFAENVNFALVLSVWKSGAGIAGSTRSIVVSGAGEIVQVWTAGSPAPRPSIARTRKTCVPAARSVYWAGERQEP